MSNFETYLMRHGEFWIQSIIEQIERIEGVHPKHDETLEHRWQVLMHHTSGLSRLAA